MSTAIEVDTDRWGDFPARRVVLVTALLTVGAVPVVAGVAVLLARVGPLGLVVAAPMVTMLLVAAGWIVLTARAAASRRLVVRAVDGSTTLPGDRRAAALIAVAGLALLVMTTSLLLVGLLALRQGGVTRALIVGLILAAIVAPVLLAVLRGRYRMNRLALTPDGVEIHGYRREAALPWSSVEEVSTLQRINLQIRAAPFSWIGDLSVAESTVGGDPGDLVRLPSASLGSGTAPTAELLDFYLRHPEHRAELGDARVVDRVRSWRA